MNDVSLIDCQKCDQDDEFLLKVYEDYINEAEEWRVFHQKEDVKGRKKSVPLLIRECDRLIPLRNEETGYIDFHPFNMPQVILDDINLIGMVIKTKQHKNLLEVQIYDGSGVMKIFYDAKDYSENCSSEKEIAREYDIQEEARKIQLDCFSLEDRERCQMKLEALLVETQHEMQEEIEENQQEDYVIVEDKEPYQTTSGALLVACEDESQEKIEENEQEDRLDQEMISQYLEIGNYVSVHGCCSLSIHDTCKVEDNNFWRNGQMPILFFKAYKITRINEAEYNDKLELWLDREIKCRYTTDL